MTGRNLGGTDLKRLHRDWRRRTDAHVGLVLDSVQTPYNVGAILRTAAAYRVEHLWLAGATADPDHDKTRKTALGSQKYLTWSTHATIDEALDAAETTGRRLVGVELADQAVPLHQTDLRGPLALVLGHEDRGLSSASLERCETVVFIPQLGRIGSLNVGAAAAIALYEAHRQIWDQPSNDPT